jgi:hypothetical protein
VALVLASSAPAALAVNPPPPPEIIEIQEHDGKVTVYWKWRSAKNQPIKTDGPWGVRLNVYIEQTNEFISYWVTKPSNLGEISAVFGSNTVDGLTRETHEFFQGHGSTDETRYCVAALSYVGDGTKTGSVFSAEGKRKCIGTQSVLIVTPGEPLPPSGPPPPTKPDLVVTRVSGPPTVSDGDTAVYEIVLWNDGTPAQGTAQIQISALGPLTLDSMVQLPDGFSCDTNDFGVACVGSLGGVDDPMTSRGVTFKMQVRGNGTGKAALVGSANHDRALDEITVDNNLKSFDINVS